MNEMLIEHRNTRCRPFVVFAQLRIDWNPHDPEDRRSSIPDIGLGRFLPDGNKRLQGGSEQKKAIESMRDLPPPIVLLKDGEVREKMREAIFQASDQIKSAIKNGFLPYDETIQWITSVGPYFLIHSFGPFNEAHLITRTHRKNESGDSKITEFVSALKVRASFMPFNSPLYRIGTREAAFAVDQYLFSPRVDTLYTSENRNIL